MSAYLVIKKSGVTIGCWSRSTEMYKAFDNAPWDDEQEFDPEKEFNHAINNIKEQIKEYQDSKETHERMLNGNLSYEERFDTLIAIKDIENEIKNCEICINDIYFMNMCFEIDKWEDDPPKWTWSVG